MRITSSVLTVLMVFMAASFAFAHEHVVVVPLNSVKKLKNIVTVAKSGGDFTNPRAAVASITDASAFNPYLVVIGPGIYTLSQTLVMKPYVSIAGSGITTTTLKGPVSTGTAATSAIISSADGTTLSDLQLINNGSGDVAVALYNSGSPIISNILAFASGATANYCIFNTSSSPVIFNGSVKATGGSTSYGIANFNASPTMYNVTATAAQATSTNTGMLNDGTSTPNVSNMTITGSGGTANYGIQHFSSTTVSIKESSIEGSTDGIFMTQGIIKVLRSTLIGGVDISIGGTANCINTDNGSLYVYTYLCIPPL